MTEHAPAPKNNPTTCTSLPAGGAASMTNGKLKSALWADLSSRPDLFEAARSLQPSFRAHATVLSVLGVLTNEGSDDYVEKEQLIRAILEEHQFNIRQRRTTPLASYWTTLLLAAFYPMLMRTRFAITPGSVDRDDLDQVVVEAFLITAASLRIEGRHRLALRLKNRTRRAVFLHVRVERRHQRVLDELASEPAADEDLVPHAGLAHGPNPQHVDIGDHSLADLLVSHLGGSIEQAQLDLIIATSVHGERLSAIVDRQHPGLPPADRARMYERTKRTHSRALARLQKLLRGVDFLCPGPRAGGLLPIQKSDSKEAT